jgi:hypothetical protein
MLTILLMQANDKDEDVAIQLGKVWPLCNADGNATVVTDSGVVETDAGAYATARTDDGAAQIAATTATDTKNTKKGIAIASYSVLAKLVMVIYPNNPTKWKELGFKVSKVAADKGKCEKIIDGIAKQFIHDGFAEVEWKSLGTEADYYVIEEAIIDPTAEANWYPANPPQCKKASAVVKPAKLNVPVWHRVTGWNSAGEGLAPSNPFGGKPIH